MILGFYFGFRCGVVSKTAKDLLSSTLFMHVIGCRSYNSEVSIFNIEAPRHLKSNEVNKYVFVFFLLHPPYDKFGYEFLQLNVSRFLNHIFAYM